MRLPPKPELAQPGYARKALLIARFFHENTPHRRIARITGIPLKEVRSIMWSLRRRMPGGKPGPGGPTMPQLIIMDFLHRGPEGHLGTTREGLQRAFGDDQLDYVLKQLERLQATGLVQTSGP